MSRVALARANTKHDWIAARRAKLQARMQEPGPTPVGGALLIDLPTVDYGVAVPLGGGAGAGAAAGAAGAAKAGSNPTKVPKPPQDFMVWVG